MRRQRWLAWKGGPSQVTPVLEPFDEFRGELAHPESVAWVAERKDVLRVFFWFLTMLAYGAYARRP